MNGDLRPSWNLGLTADEVLTTTRAVRLRLDASRPVEQDVIEDCMRVAIQAPSGRNRQQWDFIFVRDASLRAEVADIWRRGLVSGYGATSGPVPTRMELGSQEWNRIASSLDHLATHLHEVPLLLIPCLRVSDRSILDDIRGQAGNWGSVLPAFWSFMLAARERGLGTAWTTAHLSYEKEMAELLDIRFDTVVQGGLTPVAYTLGTTFKPGPRADARDFTHWDRW